MQMSATKARFGLVSRFTDGVLRPDESVDVLFILCLTQQRRFTFVVDVFGKVE
jgi:hypothetical protein